IIFIELYDFHLLFYRKLIPFEILGPDLISFNQKRTDGSQHHRVRIICIQTFQKSEKLSVKFLLLPCQIRCIEGKLPCKQTVSGSKTQDPNFKISKFLQTDRIFPVTVKRLQVQKCMTCSFCIEMLFHRGERYSNNSVFRINISK